MSLIIWPTGSRRLRLIASNVGDESKKETAERLRIAIGRPWMSPNEGRQVMELPESEQDGMDEIHSVSAGEPSDNEEQDGRTEDESETGENESETDSSDRDDEES